MQQLVNHVSPSTGYLVEKFPVYWNRYGHLTYWVEHVSKKAKDRLFVQLSDGVAPAPPKQKETADIILLLLDDNPASTQNGLVFPLIWNTDCKSVDEIVEFAERYEFNNLQKTVIMKALAALGHHGAPMWLQGDVIDLAVPAGAVVKNGVEKKFESQRAKIWKIVGNGPLPEEKRASETAHFIKHGNLEQMRATYEPMWDKAQLHYDNLFNIELLREMGFPEHYLANLETVIDTLKADNGA